MLENLTKKFDTLSDGLYAIIMTILVLSIKVPDKMSQLSQFRTDIFWFFISFIIIANQWYRRARTMVLTEKNIGPNHDLGYGQPHVYLPSAPLLAAPD